jgi:hypothetical protein
MKLTVLVTAQAQSGKGTEALREMVDGTKYENKCMGTRVIVSIFRNDKKTLCLSFFEPEQLPVLNIKFLGIVSNSVLRIYFYLSFFDNLAWIRLSY